MDLIPSATDYNLCHFWSNFEIGNLNFFRNESYETFFQYLDHTGGFYYERWGDAPVHTIGLKILDIIMHRIWHVLWLTMFWLLKDVFVFLDNQKIK